MYYHYEMIDALSNKSKAVPLTPVILEESYLQVADKILSE